MSPSGDVEVPVDFLGRGALVVGSKVTLGPSESWNRSQGVGTVLVPLTK